MLTLAANLPEALRNLPVLVNMAVLLAMVAGLTLWLAGRRVIRPVTIMAGLGAGGLLGFVIVPILAPSLAISPYLGLLGGAATGLTTALLLYKVATALTFGSAIGAGAGITAAAVLGTALTLPAASQLSLSQESWSEVNDQASDPERPGQLGGGDQPVYLPPPPRWRPAWDPVLDPLPEPDQGPEGADVQNPGVIRAKPATRAPSAAPAVRKPVSTGGVKAPAKASPKSAERPSATGTGKGSVKERVVKGAVPKSDGKSASGGGGNAGRGVAVASGAAIAPELREAGDSALAKARAFRDAASETWATWWGSIPAQNRPWIVGTTLTGIAAGTVLGLLLPAWSAGVVTALVGAAIWLPSALWLATAWGAPGVHHARGLTTGGWIAVWLVAAVIGVACQWYGLLPGSDAVKGKGKKKRAKADDGD